MGFPLPYRHAVRTDGSIQYEWSVETFPDQDRDGAYYVRGSIAWPTLNEVTGDAEGHIIVAGQRLIGNKIIIFADSAFSCIDHVMNDNGTIRKGGLAPWFNWAWSKMHCNLFMRSQGDDVHRQWLMDIVRSKMIQPQPEFPNVSIPDINDAINMMYSLLGKGGLVIHKDSKLVSQLDLWEGSGRKAMLPGVLAALILVYGYQKWPFRADIQ